jgi:hypothetical protein
MSDPVFKHTLGKKAKDKVTGLVGIITNRSECLYGCNRYLLQPSAGEDQKVPEAWWVDEDQIDVIGDGVTAFLKRTGGPMSRKC